MVGTIHSADAAAAQAQVDLTAAYDDAAGQPVDATIPAELGGTTQTPGVHDSASGTFGIPGNLILDGQGDPNAVFIFKTASTLITASASTVTLINGAQACNVFWQVGRAHGVGRVLLRRGEPGHGPDRRERPRHTGRDRRPAGNPSARGRLPRQRGPGSHRLDAAHPGRRPERPLPGTADKAEEQKPSEH
ncbi:hypothetical protein GCM10018952_77080 [Streptosporangium vulgare]